MTIAQNTWQFDEVETRRLVALYVTPDIVSQRGDFLRALDPQPGERVLDIGSGPGFLAAAIADAVRSPGGSMAWTLVSRCLP